MLYLIARQMRIRCTTLPYSSFLINTSIPTDAVRSESGSNYHKYALHRSRAYSCSNATQIGQSRADSGTSTVAGSVNVTKTSTTISTDIDTGIKIAACGPTNDDDNFDDEEEDLEEMFIMGPAGMEWGGPTRGGQRPEPTRYGDWERKGRASDF